MEITIKGDPKEIAALVLAVQERPEEECKFSIDGTYLARELISEQRTQKTE